MAYIGQSGRAISARYKEHIRYIRTNNPQSAYATHILQNKHEFGPKEEILQLLNTCTKGGSMNCLEALFIQEHHHRRGTLITKQQLFEHNPLYDLIQETDTHTKTGSDSSVQNHTGQGIHHQHKGNIT
jgi:hypothetical protein